MARAGGLALPTITEDRALGDAKIQRSLRFNRGDNALLTRTFSSAGNRRTFTLSCWIKLSGTGEGNSGAFFSGNKSGTGFAKFMFRDDGRIELNTSETSLSDSSQLRTTAHFRDSFSWYHVVVAYDTTQGTSSDRVKLYVNGTQITDFGTETYPPQNHEVSINVDGEHQIGNQVGASNYLDGYLAEYNFIDGQALDPTYFGFTDGQTGIWMPKRYEGTYGTNGFYLDFSDNTSTTTLGIDKSPNGNDFTLTNLVIGDSTLDSPSNNFCVLRPYAKPIAGASFEEGNLKFSTGSTGDGGNLNRACMNTMIPSSGKWYMEVHASSGNYAFIGVHPFQTELTQGQQQSRWMGLYNYNGDKYVAKASSSASSSTYASSYGADILGIFIDMDASTPVVYFSKNGQWANGSGSWNQSNPYTSGGAIELGDTFFSEGNGGHRGVAVLIRSAFSNAGITANVNFGQDSTFAGRTTAGGNKDGHGIGDFKYPVPTNALAICAKNLPLTIEPSILRPKKHFDTVLYSGDDAEYRKISLEFKPDLIWIKRRNGTQGHVFSDTVRGLGKHLLSNSTDPESSPGYPYVSSVVEGGFVLRGGVSSGGNVSGRNMVAWCWKAGGAAVTNTDGSITSQVSANQKAGFSVVTYTGTNGNGTFGHGLGKAPKWGVIRRRDNSSTWVVYHEGVGNTNRLALDEQSAASSSSNWWNNTSPTSTTVSVGTDAGHNGSTDGYVAYCWAEIPGYSKFGKYKGSGDAEGKHVYCGFKPAWVMIKKVSSGGTDWTVNDTTRDTINPTAYNTLAANKNDAEPQSGAGTFEGNFIDFVSDGFVLKSNAGTTNAENQSHVYMAFAEKPGTTAFATYPNAR